MVFIVFVFFLPSHCFLLQPQTCLTCRAFSYSVLNYYRNESDSNLNEYLVELCTHLYELADHECLGLISIYAVSCYYYCLTLSKISSNLPFHPILCRHDWFYDFNFKFIISSIKYIQSLSHCHHLYQNIFYARFIRANTIFFSRFPFKLQKKNTSL